MDPRFRELRRRLLPEALALDPELVRIALKARRLPFGGSLGAPDFNRAWRYEAAFRACARENPRLLPLVNAAFADKDILRTADAVHALHRLFREHGVSPASTRCSCRKT